MAKIEIYTRPTCPYCIRAKKILDGLNVSYIEYDISFDQTRQEEMIARSNRFTVPQIFFDDRSMGGSDELVELVRSGRLGQFLNSGHNNENSNIEELKHVA